MAEIQLTKIKSIYGDIKGLLGQIPQPDKEHFTDAIIVAGLNDVLNELSKVTNTDYSKYKIAQEAKSRHFVNKFDSKVVRAQLGRVISRLEEEYGFGRESAGQTSPSIAIFNKNQNEISLQINYTFNDLIERTSNEEEKTQLRELRDELQRPSKNWEKIKSTLIWILNFSKDLFLEVLPIIIQNKL